MLLVIGYQTVLFWVFCGTLNLRAGILPPDPLFLRVHGAITLERGLLLALALLVVGLGLGVAATLGWEAAGFGNLQASRSMRLAIPSATALLLATSTAFTAFFLSFLRLVGRPEPRV